MLKNNTEIRVRFCEVDALHVVWHGHYLKYFEDGREAFGEAYQLSYMDCYNAGFRLPIVSIHCEYKKSALWGERLRVETSFIPLLAAKIRFEYAIFNQKDELLARGYSEQVFINDKHELELAKPNFIKDWEQKWLKEHK